MTLGTYAVKDLVATRLQLHWALQVVATAGFTFVASEDDFSHTTQRWDRERKLWISRLAPEKRPFAVALDPIGAALLLEDGQGGELERLPIAGRTLDEAYAWLAAAVGRRRGDDWPTLTRPEHEMPNHPVRRGDAFHRVSPAAAQELAAWYDLADEVLHGVTEQRRDASPRQVWPHHFDLATSVDLGGGTSIGIGLSPGDGAYHEPYFYTNPWPYPDEKAALPELHGGASWHRELWTGAVITATALLEHSDPKVALQAYLEEAYGAAHRVLTRA